jgi:hypothetical protein
MSLQTRLARQAYTHKPVDFRGLHSANGFIQAHKCLLTDSAAAAAVVVVGGRGAAAADVVATAG